MALRKSQHFFKSFNLFIFRERRREGKKEGEKQCVVASHTPYWGPGPQASHVL